MLLLYYFSPSAPIRNGEAAIPNPAAILNQPAAILTGIAHSESTNLNVYYSPIYISVEPSSQLFVPAGRDGRIVVKLRNDGVGDFFLISGGVDKNFFQQFDYSQ